MSLIALLAALVLVQDPPATPAAPQEPPDSHSATVSHTVPSAALAPVAPSSGMAIAVPVTPAATRRAGA